MVGFRGLLAGSIMLRRIHLQHQIDSETFKIMKTDANRVEIKDLGLKLRPNESPGCCESIANLPGTLKLSIIQKHINSGKPGKTNKSDNPESSAAVGEAL